MDRIREGFAAIDAERQARIRHLEAELRELKAAGGKEIDAHVAEQVAQGRTSGSDTIQGAFQQYNQRQRAAHDVMFRRRQDKGE